MKNKLKSMANGMLEPFTKHELSNIRTASDQTGGPGRLYILYCIHEKKKLLLRLNNEPWETQQAVLHPSEKEIFF